MNEGSINNPPYSITEKGAINHEHSTKTENK